MRRSNRPQQGGRRSRHPSAIGLEVRPSFWLVRATTETPTPPARGWHAHDAEQCDELASPHWFASADERTLLHR